jgi:hypothetical protein
VKEENLRQANGQANCCKCYWNDQCCNGCNAEQECCDDFTPLYEEDWDYIIISEYESDLRDRFECYQELLDE